MNKPRTAVPDDVEAEVMFQHDGTCCICRNGGRAVQIHHIDKNPTNHSINNLAVLCLEHHEQTQIRGGFGKKLKARNVIRYRDDWLRQVRHRRDIVDPPNHFRRSPVWYATAIALCALAGTVLSSFWYVFRSDIKLFAQCDVVGPQITLSSDGRMYSVTLNAIPAPYGIGFGTQTGMPLSVLNFSTPDDPSPTIYKCEFVNYNIDPLFNISVALHITFFETLADDPSGSSVHSGAITLDRDGIVEIPKIDAGRNMPFILYIMNGTPQLVMVELPTNVSLSNRKLVSLTQPGWMHAPWGMHFPPRRIASKN